MRGDPRRTGTRHGVRLVGRHLRDRPRLRPADRRAGDRRRELGVGVPRPCGAGARHARARTDGRGRFLQSSCRPDRPARHGDAVACRVPPRPPHHAGSGAGRRSSPHRAGRRRRDQLSHLHRRGDTRRAANVRFMAPLQRFSDQRKRRKVGQSRSPRLQFPLQFGTNVSRMPIFRRCRPSMDGGGRTSFQPPDPVQRSPSYRTPEDFRDVGCRPDAP